MRKFSFSRLLRNDKLMIVASVILAVVIWYAVVYGPSVTERATITVPITVRLNTSAENGTNLPGQFFQVLSKSAESADVTVSGNRSVLGRLKAEDIVVSADLTDLLNAVEDYTVELKASRNSSSTVGSYTIEQLSLRQIKVTCDYVGETAFPVEMDASALQVSDAEKYQLGTPVLDAQLFPKNEVTVSGPKTVRDRIARIVAKIESDEQLSKSTVLPAKLVAYDSDGKQVNLSQCTFKELADQEDATTASVTVPVNYFCTVKLGVKATNLPAYFASVEDFITVSPASLDLVGQEEEVLKLAQELEQLPLDMRYVSADDEQVRIPLNIPNHVTVTENIQTVTAQLDMTGVSKKTISVPLLDTDGKTLASNVTILNRPTGTTAELSTKSLSVTVVGLSDDVQSITDADLRVAIDMASKTEAGKLNAYAVRVTVAGKNTVWVYYGEDADHSLMAYLTTKTS
ncbi:MAG: YbbR-like domain-containing protein [Acutalibacteraceae bacterium]|jgi:YbbR domain-containing protein